MREILFRGKDVKGNWHIGLLAHIGNAWYISNQAGVATAYEVIPATVGQFTGLTDKNRKKIFEGDVIQQTNLYDNLEMTGVVVFSKSSQFVIHHTYTKNENIFKAEIKKAFAIRSNCRIIGNIHDNPELLEVQ